MPLDSAVTSPPSNASATAPAWQLRDYQAAAVDATLRHFRASSAPACLVLPTGAGKSLIIAELARLAKGRVLVLAHVKELCEQNHEKFSRCGQQAGLFVAGLGRKESEHSVTFASVQSVHRNLERFVEPVSLLVIDECHRLSDADDSQFQQVIRHLRNSSPRLKLLGLTATPYRLGYGWIYRYHHTGKVRDAGDEQLPPPFEQCVYEVSLSHLIQRGYLAPPDVIDAPVAQYDFSSLTTDRYGHAPERAVNQLLVKHARVTESIVAQVQELAAKRRGVMLFAATVQHAKEVASYLPAEQTGLVLGDTPSAERDAVIAGFKAQRLKYLVNVSVLTTGFDAPHVDVIAILRRTESASLFQQIAGRGLRQYPGKTDCIIVDYAGNGFNLFQPEVGERRPSGSVAVVVPCPECGHENQFWGNVDAHGAVLEHYGRRCQALLPPTAESSASNERSSLTHDPRERPRRGQQCSYRFRFKECGACGAECDIAARRCPECQQELVDPDDQLRAALKLKDALVLRVAGMTLSAKEERLCVTYHDEDGQVLHEFFDFTHPGQRAVFHRIFTRRWDAGSASRTGTELTAAADAVRIGRGLKHPDFVVARKVKHYWRVQTRLFDYEGRYRKANELR